LVPSACSSLRAKFKVFVVGDRQPTRPKCGVPMVLRTANRGGQAGKQFFGGSNYPKCREIYSFG
jgi:hypothetical protein